MATFVELIPEDLAGFNPSQAKVVHVKGQLDESNVDEEAKKIYQIIDGSGDGFTLLLEFSELEYMNSKAVGYLTDWYTKLSDKSGKILIVQPKENILDILQVVGLTQLIQTYPTMDEARLALNQGAAPATPAPAATPVAPMQTQQAQAPAAPAPAAPVMTEQPAAPVQATAPTAPAMPEQPAAVQTPTPAAPVPAAPAMPEQPAAPTAPTSAAPQELNMEAPATPEMPTEGEQPPQQAA